MVQASVVLRGPGRGAARVGTRQRQSRTYLRGGGFGPSSLGLRRTVAGPSTPKMAVRTGRRRQGRQSASMSVEIRMPKVRTGGQEWRECGMEEGVEKNTDTGCRRQAGKRARRGYGEKCKCY